MFSVYGVSMKECRKQAAKKVHALLIGGHIEQSNYECEVQKLTLEIFKTAKPKSISGELSCPERVNEFLTLAKKDKSFKDLKPMKRIQKLDGNNEPILTKQTKKPILKWVEMSKHEFKEIK